MACLSRPHVAHGRRLSELLEQQQEPFLLDVYLLERGYSDRANLAAHRSSGIVCWPGNACKRLQVLTTRGFKTCRERLLKRLSRAKVTKNCPFTLNYARRSGSRLGCWNCMEVDSGQRGLSPVSVLELQYSRHSSPPHRPVHHVEENISTVNFDLPRKVLHIFNELLEVAYTPAFYKLLGSKRQLHQSDKLLLDYERNYEEKKGIHEGIPPWERKKYFASTKKLIISDLSCSNVQWSCIPQPQVKEIAVEIEASLFEDIKEETILEMLGSHCTCVTSS